MAAGFSPLDEELGLLPGALTPPLQAHLSRLGARLSFAEAAQELWHLKGGRVAATTVRRHTEADGALYAARQDAAASRVLASAPPAPLGPPVQQVSVDGAMVGLVDGSWREVRTLAIGTVVPGRAAGIVRCAELAYFSRLADATTFTALAAGEVHRRGVETAGRVAGVADGAEWCQQFFDAHRPDAVRILDFPHAAQRLTTVAEGVWGTSEAARTWAAGQRAALRDGPAEAVLAAIRALPLPQARDASEAARIQRETLGSLEPRVEQMRYPQFRDERLPIGSGVVESANKLVVEARLQGAGRRWAEAHVTPMVALRGAVCSGRWEEAWTEIAQARHRGPRPAAPPRRPRDPQLTRAGSAAHRQRAPHRRSSLEALPRCPTVRRKTLTRTQLLLNGARRSAPPSID